MSKQANNMLRIAVAVMLLMSLVLSLAGSMPRVQAVGTTYYVNNKAGSGCSNSGAGTSMAAPWCDFTGFGAKTFAPGDQILLARGAVWSNGMTLAGSGTSANHIKVDAYGSGAKPQISGSSVITSYGIIMTNPSYWDIANLEIAATGNGIRVEYNTLSHDSLTFSSIDIHDVLYTGGGTGIDIWGYPTVTSTSQYVLRDLRISNVNITSNKTGLLLRVGNTKYDDPSVTAYPNILQNVLIANCTFDNIKENGISALNVSHLTLLDTRINNTSQVYFPQGTTADFFVQVDDVRFVNSIVTNTANTGSFDMSGFDSEAFNNNIRFEGNYFGGHSGPAIEYLALNRAEDFNTNNLVASNAFYGNNLSGSSMFKSSLLFVNAGTTYPTSITGTARDNLYYEPTGFVSVNTGAISWTFTNNLGVGATDMYNAGNDYSGTGNTGGSSCTAGSHCWSYQKYNGTSYSALAYDSVNGRWGTTGGYMNRFNVLPTADSSEWLARAWTAPVAGTVSLRGIVLKNDIAGGDGVRARITKNGSVIWPTAGGSQSVASNYRTGYESKLDSVSVNAGDIIRFEVNGGTAGSNTNDLTSWMPTVAYSVKNASLGLKAEWKLDETAGTSASDSSGSGNTGTLVNGPVWTTGKKNNALSFDGIDDYMNVPDSAALDGMGALTVSAWVNLAQLPAQSYDIVAKDTSDYSYRLLIGSNGQGHFAVNTTNNGWYSTGTVAEIDLAITAGGWHHLVGTYDGSRLQTYVDGVPSGVSPTPISGTIVNGSSAVRLGFTPHPTIDYFKGNIDEVRIYDRALSPTEVKSLYDSY
ncbi:LamG domain-containing protein [Paenibacillus nasutitermitis]|uniref:LamG-like jellyroll fold domain-containing protein n=1 Tax=Paenibacillus nasutitermitis TaxID=1652958 RepID=A0A916YS54_9BACL|nr:LamG domain-containing protein [Paenibacillus nasutitermitis]GGD57216.1 hypothetical protein GCM10010911_13760 [Paenibacillus nasutitermitis]